MSNMLNHSKTDETPPNDILVSTGDLLFHKGFRYVLTLRTLYFGKIVEGVWIENKYDYKCVFEWVPYGDNAEDAQWIPFDRDNLIPARWISDENVLFVIGSLDISASFIPFHARKLDPSRWSVDKDEEE